MEFIKWPWDVLSKAEILSDWHRFIDEGQPLDCGAKYLWDGLHEDLQSSISVVFQSRMGRGWMDAISPWTDQDLAFESVKSTAEVLDSNAVDKEVSEGLVFALCSAVLRTKLNQRYPIGLDIANLSYFVGDQFLSGWAGLPDPELVLWLFRFSKSRGSGPAASRLQTLELALAGDRAAQRSLVETLLPEWQKHADKALAALEWNRVDLGFPYAFAVDSLHEPELMILRAKLLYGYGRHGDEDKAVALAVQSALSGHLDAWRLLQEWADLGDADRVLRLLLQVGIAESGTTYKASST